MGKSILEENRKTLASSWFWAGLNKCKPTLLEGACYQVGAHSKLDIKGTPWICKLEGFRIPASVIVPPQYAKVKDLMVGGYEWNSNLVRAVFPSHVSDCILNTPILDLEHERLIWTPSSTGMFSVKSTYRMMIVRDEHETSQGNSEMWKLVWGTKLHGRLLLLLWKMLNNCLPTLDRICKFKPEVEPSCYLCGSGDESIKHLVLQCPICRLLWWNSPWNLRIDSFKGLEVSQWITILLKEDPNLQVSSRDRRKMLIFMVTMFEQMWLIRNKVWVEGLQPDWNAISNIVNASALRYQKGKSPLSGRRDLGGLEEVSRNWTPPCAGELKLNFDAAFKDGRTSTSVTLRNSSGEVKGAWVNHFSNENSFCAEAEAAIQALRIVTQLNLGTLTIEGDAMFVILALQGMSNFEDWRAKKLIEEGKKILAGRALWNVKYVPRNGNACAHHLTKWAFHSNFCGCVDTSTVLSVLPDGCLL